MGRKSGQRISKDWHPINIVLIFAGTQTES
jgi:hypothetical protein